MLMLKLKFGGTVVYGAGFIDQVAINIKRRARIVAASPIERTSALMAMPHFGRSAGLTLPQQTILILDSGSASNFTAQLSSARHPVDELDFPQAGRRVDTKGTFDGASYQQLRGRP